MREKEAILLVEDDSDIARIICDHLRKQNYFVTWASTGKEGLEDFLHGSYDLVLADVMMPEMDGFTLCKSIRLRSEVPLLIISAKTEQDSMIHGLDLGADDYITKPFSLEELSARISSHLRRYRRYMDKEKQKEQTSYIHGLRIDFTTEAVYLNEEPLLLTTKEKDLLLLMAKNPFQTFSKAELYQHVWQQEDLNSQNTVTVHIKSLRTKLKDETRAAKFIQTVWGVGYRFIGEQEE